MSEIEKKETEEKKILSNEIEALRDLEKEFIETDLKTLTYQTKLNAPLFEKRRDILKKIPRFWPMVLEQFGETIEAYINPKEEKLLEDLIEIHVTRNEKDVRSFKLIFEFGPNEYLENPIIEKEFIFEENDEQGGYSSEAVDIKWKKGKELVKPNANSNANLNSKSKSKSKSKAKTFFSWLASPIKEDDSDDACDLAIEIADNLYPNAVKLYVEAINEELEDDNEEIDLEDESESDDEDKDEDKDEDSEDNKQETDTNDSSDKKRKSDTDDSSPRKRAV